MNTLLPKGLGRKGYCNNICLTFSCRADFEVPGDGELSAEVEELLQKKEGGKLILFS